jgi:hypothetical protein
MAHLLSITLLLCAVGAPSANPATQDQHQSRPHLGFAEFVLNRVNPRHVDFGARIELRRRILAERSLLSPYFWILAASSSLAAVSLLTIRHQRREALRRELVTASVLALYHNSLVDARNHAENIMERYQQLVESTRREQERTERERSGGEREISAQDRPPVNPAGATEMFLSGSYRPRRETMSAGENKDDGTDAGSKKTGNNQADLNLQIDTLQKQLNQSTERERSLRKRVVKVPVAVPASDKAAGSKGQ